LDKVKQNPVSESECLIVHSSSSIISKLMSTAWFKSLIIIFSPALNLCCGEIPASSSDRRE